MHVQTHRHACLCAYLSACLLPCLLEYVRVFMVALDDIVLPARYGVSGCVNWVLINCTCSTSALVVFIPTRTDDAHYINNNKSYMFTLCPCRGTIHRQTPSYDSVTKLTVTMREDILSLTSPLDTVLCLMRLAQVRSDQTQHTVRWYRQSLSVV